MRREPLDTVSQLEKTTSALGDLIGSRFNKVAPGKRGSGFSTWCDFADTIHVDYFGHSGSKEMDDLSELARKLHSNLGVACLLRVSFFGTEQEAREVMMRLMQFEDLGALGEHKTEIKIVITRHASHSPGVIVSQLIAHTESAKRLTTNRVARLLARIFPSFHRRKGRYSRFAGVEILPAMEVTPEGWRAWRLETGDDEPSGYEPPLRGRVGRANSVDNPRADRSKGVWQCADVSLVQPAEAPGVL